MRRRNFLAALPIAGASPFTSPPNIALFIADDHGLLDTPVYGSRVVRTPTLDRLAASGMVFENAFAGSPTCVPSRAILTSGLMSVRNGVEANHTQMKPDVRTLPSYLASLGYRVAHFGKSHFQPAANYKEWEAVPSEIRRKGLWSDLDTAAVDGWLAEHGSKDKRPLCLVIGCHSPHVYWEEAAGYDPNSAELPPTFVDTPETRAWRARYYTDVTKMDQQLGEVYNSVFRRTSGNTLFIYISDNGAQWPFAKWSLYDAGIRLPMVAVWPGVVRAGSRSRAMVSFADILPTLIELAGGKAPGGLDGRSFAGVLRGNRTSHRTHVFATHSGDGTMNVYPIRAVRDARFKYILNLHPEFKYTTHIDSGIDLDGKAYWDSWVHRAQTDRAAAAIVQRYHLRPREELYDTQNDPHETQNLAGRPQHRGRLIAMRRQVEGWMRQQGDQGRVFNQPRLLSSEP
ncbi:MAG: sulfatase [Bryobacterales bacterium]|nr:sulfatase [Bryobacterales bacterium]